MRTFEKKHQRVLAAILMGLLAMPCGLQAQNANKQVWWLKTDKGQYIEMSRVKKLANVNEKEAFEVDVFENEKQKIEFHIIVKTDETRFNELKAKYETRILKLEPLSMPVKYLMRMVKKLLISRARNIPFNPERLRLSMQREYFIMRISGHGAMAISIP